MSGPYIGDFIFGATSITLPIETHKADGTPITLAGSPAVSVYKDNGAAQSTTGVTLNVDFDSLTGSHLVVIDSSQDASFYASGHDFHVKITAGTVDGISVVGAVIGSFSIENRSALRPTTAGRTLDVASTGEAGIDFTNKLDTAGILPSAAAGAAGGLAIVGSKMDLVDSPSATALDKIDSQLSRVHGAGAWGAGAVGTIAYPYPLDPFLDSNNDPMVGVKIEAHSDSDRTALVDVQTTDINGNFQFHLNAGNYWFRASLQRYESYEWEVELA
jgi:hypothetical protein